MVTRIRLQSGDHRHPTRRATKLTRTLALGCGIIATLVASACKGSRDTSGVPGAPAPAVSPAAKAEAAPAVAEAPRARTKTLHITGFQFVPKSVDVMAGDTLIWVNDDAVPHTATADGGEWSSREIPRGQSWTMVVRTGGAYHCEAHKVMRGSLNLKAP